MARILTYDSQLLQEGKHYFREDRESKSLALDSPQELICTKIYKGSADFTTIDYEEGEDEQGFYTTGEKFHFKAKYIMNQIHTTKDRAIEATIMTLDAEIINLQHTTVALGKLIERLKGGKKNGKDGSNVRDLEG